MLKQLKAAGYTTLGIAILISGLALASIIVPLMIVTILGIIIYIGVSSTD